jgi:cytochrome oxidase Cu insertion factor (SCO1/SenC/PrrC family)
MIGFSRAIVRLCIVIALVAWGVGTVSAEEESKAVPQPMIGVDAPGFELQSIGGDTLSLADLRGKFVVIHFGASW